MQGADGDWVAGYIPPISDAAPLADSLNLLATLTPDVVLSSAFPGEHAVHVLDGVRRSECVERARPRLAAVA